MTDDQTYEGTAGHGNDKDSLSVVAQALALFDENVEVFDSARDNNPDFPRRDYALALLSLRRLCFSLERGTGSLGGASQSGSGNSA